MVSTTSNCTTWGGPEQVAIQRELPGEDAAASSMIDGEGCDQLRQALQRFYRIIATVTIAEDLQRDCRRLPGRDWPFTAGARPLPLDALAFPPAFGIGAGEEASFRPGETMGSLRACSELPSAPVPALPSDAFT